MDIALLASTLKGILDSGLAGKAVEKMEAAKSSNDKDRIIASYEEFFTQLIDENQQLKTIALSYKEEFDEMNLTEQDIQYLRNTAHRLIKMFIPEVTEEEKKELRKKIGDKGVKEKIKEKEAERKEYETFIDFIQVDTLRTMQLLGFNYKKAIGEPLTEFMAYSISKNMKNDELQRVQQIARLNQINQKPIEKEKDDEK